MGLVIPGFIFIIIWFFVQIATRKVPVYDHIPERKPSAAILAKQHNIRLRQERERLEDQELLDMSRKEKGPIKQKAETAPPWFIGTWGINEPSHAEQLIINELNKYKLKWYREVSFSDLILPSGGYPRLDFYLPKYQTAIEYQGIGYHSSPERVSSDKLKARYCKRNNITLHLYTAEHYRTMEYTIADLMKSLNIPTKTSR